MSDEIYEPSIAMLLAAYQQGIFPMAYEELGFAVRWHRPPRRGIIDLQDWHCPRSLRRTIRKGIYEVCIDRDFEAVIKACAEPRDDQGVWLSPGLIRAYTALYHAGFAHSVEAWQDGELVGGLYGVSIHGLFAGESMFHRATDASKVCLIALIERMIERGFALLDVQFTTPHLEQFGAINISAEDYEQRLAHALRLSQVSFVDRSD